jgi:von Willebrand factor type A domain/Aerotolerance regulator N-terminal
MQLGNSKPIAFLARYWFPMALIALLVLAIPGFVLFALNLAGLQDPVNRRLEDTFKLSYHPLIPGWAGVVLLLIPLAVLLLYFLKLKRRPLAVPSTFLWRKSIEDLHVNSLLQWLRQNVLLLLQILALLALIYGVMAFRFHGRTAEGKHYIIMIDNSASMAATDQEPTRLEWAKAEALKEIDSYGEDDYGMIIVFNSSAEILQSYTNQRALLRGAVESIEQTQRPTRIDEALSLADSLANPVRSAENEISRPANEQPGKERTYVAVEGVPAEVHLFSDGRFPPAPDFTLGNLNVNFHVAGQVVLEATGKGEPQLKPAPESADNIGLVTFNARRDEADPRKLQVFATAMNYRSSSVRSKIQLDVHVNGQLKGVYEKQMNLPARQIKEEKPGEDKAPVTTDTPGEGSVNFDLEDLDDRTDITLHARLTNYELSGEKIRDKFPLDDEAWLVVGVVRKARVLIVGRPNPPLSAFFDDDATREVADVSYLSPGDLEKDTYQKDARNGNYDLVVFDRCGPAEEKDMPRSNTFFIGYPPPPWKLSSGAKQTSDSTTKSVEKITAPRITGWLTKHPILRYLAALHEIGTAEAFQMKDLPQRTPKLIETSNNVAIMLTLNRESFTDLVMTFALLTNDEEARWNTDWPLKPSFPLFLRNVLYTLGNVSDAAYEENVQPGQVKIIRPDKAVRKVEITAPDHKSQSLGQDDRQPKAAFPFGGTDQVGIYQAKWDGGQRSFAVNLLDAEESNIEPRPSIQIGNERVTAGQQTSPPRDLWKWFVLAAFLLLLLEWYIYNRRIYI